MLNRKFVSRSDGLKTLTDPLTPGKLKKTSGPLLLGICFRTFISFFEWLGWKKKSSLLELETRSRWNKCNTGSRGKFRARCKEAENGISALYGSILTDVT